MNNCLKSVTELLCLLLVIGLYGCLDLNTSSDGGNQLPVRWEDSEWDIQHQNDALGKGINLGNALDAPHEGDWHVTLQPEYFANIAELGFQSVRLPVRWSNHVGSSPDYTIDQAFLDRVDWAIDQALSNDLRIIVNIHHFEDLMIYPDSLKPVFLSIWKQLSEHYKDYGPKLYFELLNEPNENLTADLWNGYLKEALEIVRENNPKRSVLIGTADWGNISSMDKLRIPDDDHVIVTVHYYSPNQFVFQGAHWIKGSDIWMGTKWNATHTDTSLVNKDLQRIEDWARLFDVPVNIGEYGSFDSADAVSRVLYTSFLSKEFVDRGWSCAYWKYNTEMGIYDDENDTIRTHLAKAVLSPQKTLSEYLKLVEEDEESAELPDSVLLLDDFEDSEDDRADQIPMAGLFSRYEGIPLDSALGYIIAFHNDSSAMYNADMTRIFNYLEVAQGAQPNFATAVGPVGETGNALHLICSLEGDNYPYVGFGTSFIGEYNKDWFDFSSLEGVSFRAKGYGEMFVFLETDTVLNGYPEGENWGHFVHHFSLTSEWKQYVFPIEDFRPRAWSPAQEDGLSWEDGMKKVYFIGWQSGDYGRVASDSLEIYIDDIQLHGMNLKDFGVHTLE